MSKEQEKNTHFLKLPLWGNAIAAAPVPSPIVTDPDGSYTGRTKEPYEKPVQDADDL